MTDEAEIKAKRRPYEKPEVEQVRLVSEEAILTGCKKQGTGGPLDSNCNPPKRPRCSSPSS